MEQNKSDLWLKILVSSLLFLAYVQCRVMYLAAFWMGFPGFNDWVSLKESHPNIEPNKPPIETFFFLNRDLPRLAILYVYATLIGFLSWLTGFHWLISLSMFAALSLIVFGYNLIIARIQVKAYKRMRDLEAGVNDVQNAKR